ncbi:hypothetical protein WJX81_002902 [Elliptochloris bilobata]|uniref:AB hydrolase-1 domain-containing protein n=1 Tax=Elliptochloris bilobata TaxID=381761 RepID=A0AAW1SCX1_9CHLO
MGTMLCFSDEVWQECAYDGYVWKFLTNDFIEYLQSKGVDDIALYMMSSHVGSRVMKDVKLRLQDDNFYSLLDSMKGILRMVNGVYDTNTERLLDPVPSDYVSVASGVAYEMVQGALVRWSEVGPYCRPPPTCVLLHGILGSRRNLTSFAHRLVEGFPSWQVLLVDLRCHGESTQIAQRPPRPHSVESAAEDVLTLLGQLKLFPEVLVGHSFGGKVVMSMVEQFGRIGSRLPRPVQVWVLDALPGEVRAGEAERKDHPADLIETLRRVVLPLRSRATLQEQLLQAGFSPHIARWTTTNLRPINGDLGRGLAWTFDLAGIGEMYASYEATSLWPFLRHPVAGARVSFVRAEGSNYRWAGGDEQRITALGHNVHLLRQAGHWVASDNPDGLFEIMAPSFGTQPDLHMQRTSMLRSLA